MQKAKTESAYTKEASFPVSERRMRQSNVTVEHGDVVAWVLSFFRLVGGVRSSAIITGKRHPLKRGGAIVEEERK